MQPTSLGTASVYRPSQMNKLMRSQAVCNTAVTEHENDPLTKNRVAAKHKIIVVIS